MDDIPGLPEESEEKAKEELEGLSEREQFELVMDKLSNLNMSQHDKARMRRVLKEIDQYNSIEDKDGSIEELVEKRREVWAEELTEASQSLIVGAEFYIEEEDGEYKLTSNLTG